MKARLFLPFVLALVTLASAAPTEGATPAADAPKQFPALKTTDGKEYRQVTVTGVTSRSLMVTHEGGEAIISLGLCPPEVQTAFNYDPARQAQSAARARAEADRIAENVRRGQEAKAARRAKQKEADGKADEVKAQKEAEKIFFVAEVAEVLEKGVVLKRVEYAKAGGTPVALAPETLIYLECADMGALGRPNYKRGDVRRLTGWPTGQYTYTDKKGAKSFIPAYAWHWSPEHRATMAEVNRQMAGR